VYKGAINPDGIAEFGDGWAGPRPGPGLAATETWKGSKAPVARAGLGDPLIKKNSYSRWACCPAPGPQYDGGVSLAAGARGDYNAHWTTLAERLVTRHGEPILRIGHEFNGAGTPGGRRTDPASYPGTGGQVVRPCGRAGRRVPFDWNRTTGTASFPPKTPTRATTWWTS